VKKSWVIEIANRLIDEDLGLKWNVPTTRSEAIDEEVVALLAKSGCTNLRLTPDSGSVRQIEEMEKMVDLDEVAQTLQVLLDQNITVEFSLVIGFPNETHKDILQSILYGIRVSLQGAPSVIFYPFTPYPGSAYFQLVQERNQLPELGPDFDRFLVTNIYNEIATMRSYSQHVSSLSLRAYVSMAYLSCYLIYVGSHPREIPGIWKRVATKSARSGIENLMIGLLEKMKPENALGMGKGLAKGLGARLGRAF
jgi:anaerobic magnesium-protoporphyrin IX monomethyl ester cyclase